MNVPPSRSAAGEEAARRPACRTAASPPLGRDGEIERILQCVTRRPGGPQALLLLGEEGIGRTTLLRHARELAADDGTLVLSAQGWAADQRHARACLQQLLAPVLDELPGLPAAHGEVLSAALNPALHDTAPDDARVRAAVLALLDRLASSRPVLLCVDDIHACDRAFLDALCAGIRLLAGRPVRLLLTARGEAAPPGLPPAMESLQLGPLSAPAAAVLLDRQPAAPTGRRRLEILEEAEGNPLALVELSRRVPMASRPAGVGGAPARRPSTAHAFAARLDALPAETGRALLYAAAAVPGESVAALMAALDTDDLAVWAPAEAAGLVTLVEDRLDFRHPLARSAAFSRRPAGERQRAHRDLAETVIRPENRARHLAAATLRASESVAAALEDSAWRHGDVLGTARALEQAARLSPGRRDRARRLAAALGAAHAVGDPGWVRDLYGRFVQDSGEPELVCAAAGALASILSLESSQRAAFDLLVDASEQFPAVTRPTALAVTAMAATIAAQSGLPEHKTILPTLLTRARQTDPAGGTDPAGEADGACGTGPAGEADRARGTDPVWGTDPARESDPIWETDRAREADPARETDRVRGIGPVGESGSAGEAGRARGTGPAGESGPAWEAGRAWETDPARKSDPPAGEAHPAPGTGPARETDRVRGTGPARESDPARETGSAWESGPAWETDPAKSDSPAGEADPAPGIGPAWGETDPAREIDRVRGTGPAGETGPAWGTGPVRESDPAGEARPVGETRPAWETDPARGTGPARESAPVGETRPARETGPAQEAGPVQGTDRGVRWWSGTQQALDVLVGAVVRAQSVRPRRPYGPDTSACRTAVLSAAYLADEADVHLGQFRETDTQLRTSRAFGIRGWTVLALVDTFLSIGWFTEAETLIQEATAEATVLRLPRLQADLQAQALALRALRGTVPPEPWLTPSVWRGVCLDENRATHARLLRARGLASIGLGDWDGGWRHLRELFTADGSPLHPVLSPRSIAELAVTAQRVGRSDEVMPVLTRVRAAQGDRPSTRMTLLLHHATALVDPDEDAEQHFHLALVNHEANRWPWERAHARLSYGIWLRRCRRTREARQQLTTVLETAERLGAGALAASAARELRASGAAPTPDTSGLLERLTAQQRQIAQLAARGLSNREIGEQLFLSPRTVGSHLYNVYPKLGISRRQQLRDLLQDR
ncbi:AAA family ATPase [Streptomyces shenzhenensis]